MYLRTNRVDYVEQVSRFQRRVDNMGRISERDVERDIPDGGGTADSIGDANGLSNDCDEDSEARERDATVGNARYRISKRGTVAIDAPSWLMRYRFDPATQASHVVS